MASQTRILCDVCGAEKKEQNHWFRCDFTIADGIKFERWNYDEPIRNLHSEFHLCGSECCQRKLAEWTK